MTLRARSMRGFTLIEVLAVLLLTALVLGVALDFYVDLSNQSAYAADTTREVRRAATLLDRIASDLERAMLARKPEETDPLAHPWVFVAESRSSLDAADRVKFLERRSQTRLGARPVPEIEQVAFLLREPLETFDGQGFELVRWSAPGLPEALDREFPLPDDPAALVLAHGVEHFGLRFLGDDGEWHATWDSSQILESSELPIAVEIAVAFAPALADGPAAAAEPLVYRRRVMLPVRPLDLTTLLDPEAYAALGGEGAGEGEGEGEEDNCAQFTVRDCVDLSLLPQATAFDQLADTSWCAFKAVYKTHPAVRPQCR